METKKAIINLSGTGGLCPQYYDSDWHTRIIGAENQYADGIVNPYHKLGRINPAKVTFTACKDSGAAELTSFTKATQIDTVNSHLFFFLYGKIHELTTYTDTVFDTTAHTLTACAPTDLEIYMVNGVRKLFFSYKKASSTDDIGIFDFSSTWDDDWLSTACSGAFHVGTNWHKMIVADNGYMYVLDGSAVHKIDGSTDGGANGTVTANVLLFPATFQLIDGVDIRGLTWMAIIQSSRNIYSGTQNTGLFNELCGVYIWDRQSTQANMQDFIPINGIREIRALFSFRGIPACFTVSSNRITELRIYNGNEFEIKAEFGIRAHPRFPDSVSVSGNMITWLGDDGYIYSYGSPRVGMLDASYKIGDITGEATNYGHGGAMIAAGTTNEGYYMSINADSKGKVRLWNPYVFSAGNALAGGFKSMVKALPKLSTVKSITLYYPCLGGTGTTRTIDVNIYFNQSSTTWGATQMTRADNARGYKYIPVGKSGVNFVQIGIDHQTATGLVYQPTPNYAEIEYEVKNKKL